MDKKIIKRILIILVYVLLIALASWGVYSSFSLEETCFDSLKNQNEEKADCGGVCSPCEKINARDLVFESGGMLDGGSAGVYDFWGLVDNPNNVFGSPSFQYNLVVKDASGEKIFEKNGESFILPGEKKYIIENNIPVSGIPTKVELAISGTRWMEFNEFYEKPQLKIVNKNYSEISSGTGFSEARGLLKNESPFDFNVIRIRVLLRDSQDKIIALNSTEMRTVKSQEEREFRAAWPTRFSGEVRSVETQVDVNVYDSETFLKRYYSPQNF